MCGHQRQATLPTNAKRRCQPTPGAAANEWTWIAAILNDLRKAILNDLRNGRCEGGDVVHLLEA